MDVLNRDDRESIPKQLVLSLLKNRESSKTLKDLKRLHLYMIRTDLHRSSSYAVGNFIARCAALGLMAYAGQVFEQMPQPNSFVWNTMIRGFQHSHRPDAALLFFKRMREQNIAPDHFTFLYAIKACADKVDYRKGIWLHGQSIKFSFDSDICVRTNLIGLYLVCGDVTIAKQLFDEMPVRDAISWTVIISSYVNRLGDMKTARRLFDEMPMKDLVAWSTMIGGYVKIGDMEAARELFDRTPSKDLLMCNTMLGGYAKSGELNSLVGLFDEMSCRDVVSWNTVICGLVQSKRINEAMALFHRMQLENVKPNEVTFVSILSGCSQVGALDVGRWIHSFIDRSGFHMDAVVGTAVVDMYSKCGVLESAWCVFHRLPNRDVAAWNAMIMGFCMNGQSRNALEFFYQMQEEDVKPNEVTMVGVLSACSHAGLVEEGRRCFNSMPQDLGITPKIEHYGCMVDLLGRAGLLKETYEFIQFMPVEPHVGVWGALLGACKIHGNVELAECAIKHLMELDTKDGGYLAVMSNIYANAKRWHDVARVRELMREKGVGKLRGCSSLEVNGEIHEFSAGDKTHPRSEEIYEMIAEMSEQLRRAGHVARTDEVFFDVEEEEKEHVLCLHSEKLAIAFGLVSMSKGSVIRVVKNLRVCIDCHSSIKLIAKIFNREIVVRDRSRFHHFKDGSCSCGDYW